jgi:undecaprenyl-diphosphatase
VNRARPAIALFSENGAAFPSNHAALSVAFYGFIFAFLFSISAGRATKTFTIIAGIIVAALLGFSRVYLGVHYPSDVLTGYFIGAFWLFLCLRFIKK